MFTAERTIVHTPTSQTVVALHVEDFAQDPAPVRVVRVTTLANGQETRMAVRHGHAAHADIMAFVDGSRPGLWPA